MKTRADLQFADVPTISCDGNSCDLSPVVDQLEKMIKQRASKGPVVVLLSEVHPVGSNVILPMLLMERLQNSSNLKIALGIERSHDLLDRLTECQTGNPIPDHEWGSLSAADKDGRRLVDAYLQTALTPDIEKSTRGILQVALPACHRHLMEYVRDNDISIRAVDAGGSPDGPRTPDEPDAQEQKGLLDITSRSTFAIIEKHAPDLMSQKISAANCIEVPAVDGIWLRNEHAVERVKAHMEHTGADVYVLPYGGAHLCGWKPQPADRMPKELPARQSLNAIFEREGIETLTVFMSYQNKFVPQNIPDDANPEWLKKGIIVNGINSSAFWQDPRNSAAKNAGMGEEEEKFLQDVLVQSGSSFAAIGPARPAKRQIGNTFRLLPSGTVA